MGFEIIQKLTVKEKQRKTEEAKKWLLEQGELPDLETIRNTLLEAHSLTKAFESDAIEHAQNAVAIKKLSGHIEELIKHIKI